MSSDAKKRLVRQLSFAVFFGEHSLTGVQKSLSYCLGLNENLTKSLADEIYTNGLFSACPLLVHQSIASKLAESPALKSLAQKMPIKIINWPLATVNIIVHKKMRWDLPSITNDVELATFLGTNTQDLIWFSGRFKNTHATEKQNHYYYRFLNKASGKLRLLEIPKSRLKEIQKTIYSNILSLVPVHESAHGFVKGRSITSFAAPHVGKAVVIHLDIENFFCSIFAGRIFKTFQLLGYQNNIATYLAACCLHQTPESILDKLHPQCRSLFRLPHLPQGACTSPALANLATFNLDLRLNALARSLGFEYSRYADDLAFSSESKKQIHRLLKYSERVITDEGFKLNQQKTRVHDCSQRQSLCGLVVNEKINLPRKQIKLLEAELFNCVRSGSELQNRLQIDNYRLHLQGRISHVSYCAPQKARKLWNLFDQINW